MAVMAIERSAHREPARHDSVIDVVRAAHDALDLPEGYLAEILEGQLSVVASPFGKHAFILHFIRQAVAPALPPEYGLFDMTTAEEPDGDRYIPDLVAWPVELMDTETEWVFDAGKALLAVEVTSPGQADRDYRKAAGYARAGVPIYLLVDRSKRESLVFTEPAAGRYATTHREPFGKPVVLPLETPVSVDTSRF